MGLPPYFTETCHWGPIQLSDVSGFFPTPTPVPAETQGSTEPSLASTEAAANSRRADTGMWPQTWAVGLPKQAEGAGRSREGPLSTSAMCHVETLLISHLPRGRDSSGGGGDQANKDTEQRLRRSRTHTAYTRACVRTHVLTQCAHTRTHTVYTRTLTLTRARTHAHMCTLTVSKHTRCAHTSSSMYTHRLCAHPNMLILCTHTFTHVLTLTHAHCAHIHTCMHMLYTYISHICTHSMHSHGHKCTCICTPLTHVHTHARSG